LYPQIAQITQIENIGYKKAQEAQNQSKNRSKVFSAFSRLILFLNLCNLRNLWMVLHARYASGYDFIGPQ